MRVQRVFRCGMRDLPSSCSYDTMAKWQGGGLEPAIQGCGFNSRCKECVALGLQGPYAGPYL